MPKHVLFPPLQLYPVENAKCYFEIFDRNKFMHSISFYAGPLFQVAVITAT